MKPTQYIYVSLLCALLLSLALPSTAQTSTRNYVLERTMTSTGNTYLDRITYYDGLGRMEEVVEKNAAPNQSDWVSYQEYDTQGRATKSWLPSLAAGNNGNYIAYSTYTGKSSSTYNNTTYNSAADTEAYGYTEYESSPLHRPIRQYGPGAAWHQNGKSVQTAYLSNSTSYTCTRFTSTDALSTVSIAHAGNYTSQELYVTKLTSEEGQISYAFRDKAGQLVLERRMEGSTAYNTHYVYDRYGNLRAVIPPRASDLFTSGTWTETTQSLKDFLYVYKYDSRMRCIGKKLPGAEWIYYVYDKNDRLIFTQDGVTRAAGKWAFTIPDAFGRTALTGTCTNSLTYTADPLASTVVTATWANTTNSNYGYTLNYTLTSPTVLTVTYYDSYEFMGKNGIPAITDADFKPETLSGYGTQYTGGYRGLMTGQLEQQYGGSGALYSVYYYDDRSRLIQQKSNNHLTGGKEKEYLAYTFTGQVSKRQHVHSATGKTTQTEIYSYAYDHAMRETEVRHQLNGGTEMILATNTWDQLGRLKTTQPNSKSALTTTYSYQIRSWLSGQSGTNFTETLAYKYNGDIQSHTWTQGGKTRTYGFEYDGLSRLKNATYSNTAYSSEKFGLTLTYDKNGNISTLLRNGLTAAGTYGVIDNLTYTYSGNQVTNITDAGPNVSLAYSEDFKDYTKGTSTEYTYDANGSITKDLNRGLSAVSYNPLNLPSQIDIKHPAAEARNTYIYSATGRKLQAKNQWNPSPSSSPVIGSAINPASLTQTLTMDYVGNMEYENGTLKRILTRNGYYSSGKYYFYIRDYLGSIHIAADQDGTIAQSLQYDPAGVVYTEGTGLDNQPYRFTGQEMDNRRGLNLYDYGARLYDPASMRFTTIDPLAEKYYSISPYVYVGNNPVNRIDPTGMIWDDVKEAERLKNNIDNKITSLNKDITKNQAKLDKGGLSEKQIAKLEDKISESQDRISNLTTSKADIDVLGTDQKNIYALSQKNGGLHQVRRGSDGKVYIETSTDALSIHEITHVRQSLDAGGLRFSSSGYLYNAGRTSEETFSDMEVKAYQMQYSYDLSFPGRTNSLQGINIHSVGNIWDPDAKRHVYPIIKLYSDKMKQMK